MRRSQINDILPTESTPSPTSQRVSGDSLADLTLLIHVFILSLIQASVSPECLYKIYFVLGIILFSGYTYRCNNTVCQDGSAGKSTCCQA